VFDMGSIGTKILECAAENPVLYWFYENNYLVQMVQKLGAKIPEIPLMR